MDTLTCDIRPSMMRGILEENTRDIKVYDYGKPILYAVKAVDVMQETSTILKDIREEVRP